MSDQWSSHWIFRTLNFQTECCLFTLPLPAPLFEDAQNFDPEWQSVFQKSAGKRIAIFWWKGQVVHNSAGFCHVTNGDSFYIKRYRGIVCTRVCKILSWFDNLYALCDKVLTRDGRQSIPLSFDHLTPFNVWPPCAGKPGSSFLEHLYWLCSLPQSSEFLWKSLPFMCLVLTLDSSFSLRLDLYIASHPPATAITKRTSVLTLF